MEQIKDIKSQMRSRFLSIVGERGGGKLDTNLMGGLKETPESNDVCIVCFQRYFNDLTSSFMCQDKTWAHISFTKRF